MFPFGLPIEQGYVVEEGGSDTVTCPLLGQGLGKVVVSGVWLGVMGAWSLWILG